MTIVALEYLAFVRNVACQTSEELEGVASLTARGGSFLLPTSPDHLPSGLLPEHFDIRFDELLYDVPCFGVIGDQFPDPR